MPGIGDYVHLNAENFQEHGITENAKNAVQYQHSKMYSTAVNRGETTPLTKQQIKELENLYNQRNLTNSQGKNIYTDIVHNAVIRKLEKSCTKIMKEWFQNDSQWEITTDGTVKLKNANTNQTPKIYNIHNDLQVNTVIRRLGQIETLLTDVYKNMNEKDLPDAARQLVTAKESVDGVIAEVTKIKKKLETQLKLKSVNGKTKFGEANLLANINYINDFIQAFCACPPISYIEGTYREIFAQTFVQVLNQQIKDGLLPDLQNSIVSDKLNARVVGSESSSLNLLKAFAFTEPSQGLNQKSFTDIFQGALGREVKLTGYSSTSKADVVIEWKDGKSTGISVKNYHIDKGMSKYISLVDGTSIFVLMSNWNPRFATTFLNLYSTHPDDTEYQQYLTTARIRIAREVIYTIIYQSLSGDVANRNKSHLADVFLFYNPSTHKYKIIQISTLLQHLQALGDYTTPMSIKISGQSKGIIAFMRDGGNPWNFKNTSVGDATLNANDMDARERIIRLLADSHNKKLHVSLKLNSTGNISGYKS